jgi:hypothetical protein
MNFPKIDTKSVFYKNCLRNRRNGAKICKVCPFRAGIEAQDRARMNAARKWLGRMMGSKIVKILNTPNPILDDLPLTSITEEACEPKPVKKQRRRQIDPTKSRRIHVGGLSVPHVWR